MPQNLALPLAGIRVLDFSNLLPGPLASLLLAEAGAEVVKVERPGTGDEMRGYEPAFGDSSGNFALLNRGKTSLCADLKDEGDRAHVLALAREADVLIEQFRPGVMERLGLGYEALSRENPRLVYCSITGYGQDGERAQKAGHDLNYMAETGLLGLTRASDGAPVLPAVLAADIGGGAYPAAINILLALQQRAVSGRGCHLDVAMCDNLFTFAYWGIAAGHAGGRWPRAGGELITGGSPRYRIYRTADGQYLAAAPIEERFWQVFCDTIGLDAAERDDRIDPAATIGKVAARIAGAGADAWRERFAGIDACVAVVESLERAIADPAFAGRGLFDRVVVASGARLPALPVPVSDCLRDPSPERESPALEPERRRKVWSTSRPRAARRFDLDGMRILLTGASGGIGQATARLLADLGAELTLTDRAEAPGLIDELRRNGLRHRFIACDVGSRGAIQALCEAAGELDAAVLNAGVFPKSSWSDEAWDDDFDHAMNVNVRAPAHFARLLLPGMKARGRGRIVLLGSIAAHTGGSYADSPLHYACSKGAVHTMVRWLARRAAPEVMVNGVAPGSTDTAMVASADPSALRAMPVPRFARPEEIAWPIAFLCSPGASFICGSVLDVNGGASMR